MNGPRSMPSARASPLVTGRSMTNSRAHLNGARPWTPTGLEKDHNCCRIVILGQPGVGKTALVVRFITKRFIGEYCPTLESIHKCVSCVDNEETKLEILDTAGQFTDSELMWKDYYAFWGDCFIFVYSINDKSSFDDIVQLKRQVETVRRANVCGIVVGNKSDLLHDRQVPFAEGSELADELGCRFYEVSAADWTDIDAIEGVFRDAVREFRRTRIARDIRSRRPSSSTRFRQAIQKVISGKVSAKRPTPS